MAIIRIVISGSDQHEWHNVIPSSISIKEQMIYFEQQDETKKKITIGNEVIKHSIIEVEE